MSDIKYNTMRFGTDEFNPFIRQALLVSKTPVDLSDFNRLDQITVQGNQPDGSKRRFLFKMNDKVYKFNGQNLVEYSGDITLDNVLADGNTAAQLESVTNNSALAGNKIYPIIALYSEVQDAPSAKLVFNASNVVEVLDYSKEMPPKYFYDADINPEGGRVDGTILGFSWDIDINGDASTAFRIQLLQNDEWSDYLTIEQARGQIAKGVRTKWFYHVDAANGTNSVRIRKFRVHWSPYTNFKVYGDTAYLTSTVKNFGLPLKSCVLVVRHEDLDGGSIQAHVSFQKKRKYISGETLSYVGPLVGANYFRIANSNFILSTLKIYRDGVQTSDFKYNPAEPDIIWVKNPDGADYGNSYSVSADYTCDADDEIWLPMTADEPEPTDNDLFTTRFFLKNPYDSDKPFGAIRLTINRGRDTNSFSRTATGEEQRVKLAHVPDEVDCDADDWWDFDEDTNEFVFQSSEGSTVNVSYDWHGKTPVITGWQAAFSC